MCSFASEPHGAPLPARAVAARRVTRTPQIGHNGSAPTWLSGNEAGERAARARREGILHLKGQAEQHCNAYQTRREAL
jgi:hypothetical protein